MNGYLITAMIAGMLLAAPATRAEIDGKKIQVTVGDSVGESVPIPVPVKDDEVSGLIQLEDESSGASFFGSARDGRLVFVVSGLKPGETRNFVVNIAERPKEAKVAVNIAKKQDEDILDVLINDIHFTSYHFGSQWKKPFLWPINSEGGVTVTRDFPMEREGTPRVARDHPHHKSLWTAYGEVNSEDFWGEGAGSGAQRPVTVTYGSGDAFGWIRSENVWEDQDGKPIIDEIREYHFYNSEEKARILDVFVTFKASYGEVLFSDTKEGGLVSVRMRPDISNDAAVITNALGDKGEGAAWGKPAAWCDFSGDIPGVGMRGLAILDHPDNLRHPTSWHVRNYGLMAANCFGYSYFNERDYNKGLIPERGDLTFQPGEEKTFVYRVFVHTGDVDEANVAQQFRDFAHPPQAKILD